MRFFGFYCLPSFHICADDTKYCKHGFFLLLLWDIEALQLIIFQVEGFLEVGFCSLQVVVGRFLLVVGGFRSFSARCRSFQVLFCSLKAVSNRFVLIVGRFSLVSGGFRSFRARCRSLRVVSCSLLVVSGRFLLVVSRFKSFHVQV